jgi:putative flippase GtrA
LNVHYSLSLLIGHILGILFNFNTTARIVFNSKDYRLLIRFFAVYGTTYVINLGALRIFKSINFNMIFAQMIMILPMALLSFFLNKKLVFN